jgi:hypothetical protein
MATSWGARIGGAKSKAVGGRETMESMESGKKTGGCAWQKGAISVGQDAPEYGQMTGPVPVSSSNAPLPSDCLPEIELDSRYNFMAAALSSRRLPKQINIVKLIKHNPLGRYRGIAQNKTDLE